MIVGVLDTGIWPEHPSFSDPDPSGKPYAPPPAAPDGSRACQFGSTTPGDVPFACNNKIIGAYRFMAAYDDFGPDLLPGENRSARDDDGHGTHTSSTAAGDAGVQASIFGIPRGTISGIAPRAYVEMFKVCGDGGCFGSDSAAAVQAAIGDGVNVINFSIGGGSSPYSDISELAFLDAYNAGIFVAASAGNDGPAADTTEHRAPWVTAVGASTTPRAFVDTVHVTADGGASMDLAGVSLTTGVGPKALVVNSNTLCDAAATAGTFTDKIVICKRGNPIGRVADGRNVMLGGAVGMILYNGSADQTDQETDNHFLPVSHIQFSQGQALLAFIGSHTGVMATISAGVKGTQQGDVMASFSSRGGPAQSLGVSKPDITAPGVQILAGASPLHVGIPSGPQGELFQAIAGTSMSSPHIAGSAALIKDLHPTWTPGQIKSAIMTTAKTAGVVKEDGVTPADAFDDGSGRVDLNVAGDPGLTFDATGDDYIAHEDDLYTTNYPSIYHPTMPGAITLTRTAHSVLTSKSDWKLTTSSPSDFKITVPKTLHVKAGGSASFQIGLDASAVALGETRFGTITLTETDRGTHRVLHLPVTIVRGQEAVTLTKSCEPTGLSAHGTTSCTVTAANPTFDDVTYSVKDNVPNALQLDRSSVKGGTVKGRDTIVAKGTLPAADPADIQAQFGGFQSPFGYVPLDGFGGTINVGDAGDETISNFDVPAFDYAGETWTSIGVVSDGYVVVGGGTSQDVQFINQLLPDEALPNNVLAPFWSDLNPAFGGKINVNVLSDGDDAWIVVEYDAVSEFSIPTRTHSMEVWIGLNSDANPGEDITFTYANAQPSGEAGFGTIGAENKFGNRGAIDLRRRDRRPAGSRERRPDHEHPGHRPGGHHHLLRHGAGRGQARHVVAQLRDIDQQRVPRDQLRLRQRDDRGPLTLRLGRTRTPRLRRGVRLSATVSLSSRRCRSVARAGRCRATGRSDPGPSGPGRRRAGIRSPRAGQGWPRCRSGRRPGGSSSRPPRMPG